MQFLAGRRLLGFGLGGPVGSTAVIELDIIELTVIVSTPATPRLVLHPAHHLTSSVIESWLADRRSAEGGLFGWYEDGKRVGGAVSMTPPYELLLAVVPGEALPELVLALNAAEPDLPGVHGEPPVADEFARIWVRQTGGRATAGKREAGSLSSTP